MSRDLQRERARRVASWPALIREHRSNARRLNDIVQGRAVYVEVEDTPRLRAVEVVEDEETSGSD